MHQAKSIPAVQVATTLGLPPIDFSSAPLPASNGEFAEWSKEDCYNVVTMLMTVRENFINGDYEYPWICLEVGHCYRYHALSEQLTQVVHKRLTEAHPGVRSWLAKHWDESHEAGQGRIYGYPNVFFLPYRILWINSMIEELNAEVAK